MKKITVFICTWMCVLLGHSQALDLDTIQGRFWIRNFSSFASFESTSNAFGCPIIQVAGDQDDFEGLKSVYCYNVEYWHMMRIAKLLPDSIRIQFSPNNLLNRRPDMSEVVVNTFGVQKTYALCVSPMRKGRRLKGEFLVSDLKAHFLDEYDKKMDVIYLLDITMVVANLAAEGVSFITVDAHSNRLSEAYIPDVPLHFVMALLSVKPVLEHPLAKMEDEQFYKSLSELLPRVPASMLRSSKKVKKQGLQL